MILIQEDLLQGGFLWLEVAGLAIDMSLRGLEAIGFAPGELRFAMVAVTEIACQICHCRVLMQLTFTRRYWLLKVYSINKSIMDLSKILETKKREC